MMNEDEVRKIVIKEVQNLLPMIEELFKGPIADFVEKTVANELMEKAELLRPVVNVYLGDAHERA